jgi:hypothetical protein
MAMTTPLDKTLKREVLVDGRAFVIALSPEGIKLTPKGKRNGLELGWADLVSGEAALATALNASIGKLQPAAAPASRATRDPPGTRAEPASRAKAASRAKKPSSRSARGKSPG